MDIRYPIRKADGREYKNYDELMTDMRKNAHGWWLVGVNRYWHGGIHAGGASSPASVLSQNEPEKSVPLQSMMDGDVVAWRVNRDYVRQPYDKTISLRHSGTFLLIKSVYKPNELDESSWLTLYQLYMHMAPLSEYPKRPMYRVTAQGNGVRMRRHSEGDEKREFAPDVITDKHGEALTLKRGESLAVLQKVTFTLQGFPEPFALVQHVKDGRPSGSLFWASMRPEYLEPDGDCYIGLPAWMYNVLNHNVFDDVVIPPAPLKVTIKAGDPVGFLGAQDMMDEDNYPDMFSSEYKTHIELLSLDEHVPDFLANAKGIKTGKQFIKLKLKRPCYLRNGEGDDATFSQMSAITRRDSGSILPRDTTHPFTDKEGVTYFQTGPHTWMHQDDVEQLSQHDLTGLNFQAIEAAPTTDFVHTLDETWLTEAFKSIATHFDSAKGPDSAQAKWFYNDLNRDLQIRDAGGMADWDKADLRKRLFAALHMTQMGIGELTRRLVVKHDSDWHSSAEDPRWSVFFKDRYIINQMKQINGGFLETTRWMDKVPPFTEHKSVWHFHPLEFLELLNPKGNCACGRDITLEELCDIAPKADKEVLAQYLPVFNDGFREFNITTCREKAHFLAQCCLESGGLRLTKEIGGERKNYAPWFGRGLIQLTWQDVYKKYGDYIGENFESDDASRNKIAQYPHCVKSAFWFYCVNKNVVKFAQKDDFNMVTALINGGFNGYNDRIEYLDVAVNTLKAEHLNVLKKETGFLFEDSEIYNYRVYAYSWGRYHDPLSRERGTDKDKMGALKAYQRAVTLYQRRGDSEKVSDIEAKINSLNEQ